MIMIMIKRIKYIPLVFVFSLVLMSTSSNLMDRYTRLIKATTMRVLGITTEEKSSFVGLFEVYAAEEEVEIVTQQPIYEDRSSSIRFNVEWPRAIRALMKNPILGTGYSSLTLATDNDYLRILGETGVLGFLSFMLVVASVIWELVKNFSFKLQSIESIFLASVIAGIPGVAINMVFIDILEASKFAIIFWLFLGMAVAASRMKKTNEEVRWFPAHFKMGRFLKSLEAAPDWNISRSRYWGSPVPVWECECGERFVPGSIAELEEHSGEKITDLNYIVGEKNFLFGRYLIAKKGKRDYKFISL